MTVVRKRAPRVPRIAHRLRLPIWQRSQARLRDHYGWDLASRDVLAKAEALVAEQPDDPERLVLLAAALSIGGDDEAALVQARRATEVAPDLARAHTTLATALTNSGETEQALQHARRAAQLDGGDPQVQYNLGLLEDTAGDRRAAREAFEAAARLMGIKSMPLLDWWRY